MIEIRNLSKKFDDIYILEDINMTLEEGKIYGIIGENGVGKTTLLQMLSGIYKVEEGEILVDGEKIYNNNKVKEKIAYVADRNQYFPNYKISEMVDFYDEVYEKFSKEDFNAYNKIFKLDCNQKINKLSKGMQMRLSLMLSLASNPEILILDEPTSGLDAMAKKDILNILISKVEDDMTIIISSHHIGDLEMICDELAILKNKKLSYMSDVEGIKENVSKVQVVFIKDIELVEEKLKNKSYLIETKRIGNVFYLVLSDYSDEIEEELKELGAISIEKLGLDLEEAFIYINKKDGDLVE